MATTQIGHLEPFEIEGDDWELYAERLDQFLFANGIDDNKKKSRSLSHRHRTESICSAKKSRGTDKPHEKDYDSLVAAMKDHLKPKPLMIAEWFKFNRRRQQEGESIAQFVGELRKPARNMRLWSEID